MDNNQFLSDWGLTIMVFLPLAGALVMLLIPRTEEHIHRTLALVVTLATAGIGAAVLADFDYGAGDTMQFVVNKAWIDVINARYAIGIDGLSVPLIGLTLLIVPLCVIYSWNHFPEPRNPKAFLILLLVLDTGLLGTFVAQDLILFFVFFEVVLLPMYFMIGVWGGEQRQYAVDQVLPVHPVRLGVDDRELPGAVLRDRGRDVRHPGPGRAGAPSRTSPG